MQATSIRCLNSVIRIAFGIHIMLTSPSNLGQLKGQPQSVIPKAYSRCPVINNENVSLHIMITVCTLTVNEPSKKGPKKMFMENYKNVRHLQYLDTIAWIMMTSAFF